MRNKMNVKNKTHKCVPQNSQINLWRFSQGPKTGDFSPKTNGD